MGDAKHQSPVATSPLLSLSIGTSLTEPTEYRVTIGSLQYLKLTRPDIAFTVNKLSQFMHHPTTKHWAATKRLLRYLQGTIDHGLLFHRDSPLALHAFFDSDWVGNKMTSPPPVPTSSTSIVIRSRGVPKAMYCCSFLH